MASRTWQIKELLRVSTDYLKEKGIENPRLNAEVLLAHQLGLERVGLYLDWDRPLTQAELAGYRSLIRRRIDREPLQYITGNQEFWSLDFRVDRRVLIPRPETEVLVEEALRLAQDMEGERRPLLVLDLGTGCGAIAIALARELPLADLWATDISGDALSVARRNAEAHRLLDKITFLQGDLWEPFQGAPQTFDIIVSNPPYVSTKEYDALPREVHDHEPREALDGGTEGMYFLEKIIRGAPLFLNRGGWIILEMSPWQTPKCIDTIALTGAYHEGVRIQDYSRRYRAVRAQRLHD